MSEDSIKQILISNRMVGIVGLGKALDRAKTDCAGQSDADIADFLIQAVSDHNYIPATMRDAYTRALLREYKIGQNIPVASESVPDRRIYVLGQGCTRCSQLENDVRDILSELQIAADLQHVTDIREMMRLGILGTPALVINDKVFSAGSVPPKSQIRQWIIQSFPD